MSVAPEGKNPLLQIAEDLLKNVQGLGEDVIDAAKALVADPDEPEKVAAFVVAIAGAKDEVLKHLSIAGLAAFGQLMTNPTVNKVLSKVLGNFAMRSFGLGGMQPKPKPESKAEPEATKESNVQGFRLCDDPWFPPKSVDDNGGQNPQDEPRNDNPAPNSPGDDIVNMVIDKGGRAFTEFKNNPGEAVRGIGNVLGDLLGNSNK